MDQYLDKFKDLIPEEVRDFNLDIVDGAVMGIEAIMSLASTLPFMSDKRVVIVKQTDTFKGKRKSQDDKGDDILINYLANPVETTCLIFCAESETVDKRRKVYKALEKKGQIVEFAPIKGRALNNWIEDRARQLGKMIEPSAVVGLVTAIGNNLRQLNNELEKLSCYSTTEKISALDVSRMVSRTAESSIFELVDAIGERHYQKAIKMAREMVFLGEPVIRILFMIARQFRLLLRAKDFLIKGFDNKQVSRELQVHPFVAQKCIRQAANFSLDELGRAMEKILKADSDIKTGRQEPMMVLELLIIDLCEKEPIE